MRIVGRLHPGEMGASIGAARRRAGVQVLWVSAGRGAATRRRAQAADLTDVGTLPALVVRSQLVMSVCPAHAGGRFVDGDLIGGPVRPGGATRLYPSGPAGAEVAALFAPTDLEAVALAGDVAAASAPKMCYAAWTKGTSALLLAIRAAAGAHGWTRRCWRSGREPSRAWSRARRPRRGPHARRGGSPARWSRSQRALPRPGCPTASPMPLPSCTAVWPLQGPGGRPTADQVLGRVGAPGGTAGS